MGSIDLASHEAASVSHVKNQLHACWQALGDPIPSSKM